VLDPATGSPNASELFDVTGARSFHLGSGSPDEVAITAVDEVTLKVELDRISPYFPNMFFAEWTKPVPRHAVEEYGPFWMEPDNIVTNGAFRLVSLQPGESVVMARNPDYHGSFSGNVEQLEIDLQTDHLRQLKMYLAGKLDVLYTVSHLPPEVQDRLREELVSEYRSGPEMATWFVGFVLSQSPFDDRRVRRAFAMATDRHMLANGVRRGLVYPATGGFLSPVHAAYSEGIALPYDPDRARHLLAEAGYPDGAGLPTIMMVNGHPSLSVETELRYLQAQWREHLGVELMWETIAEMADFMTQMRLNPPHLFYVGWTGKHTDPDDFLRETSFVWKWARWHDKEYRALVNRARELTDGNQRMALFRQADKMLVGEAVLLPLSYDRNQLLVKPWVRRFATAAIPSWFFTEVILEPH
jgi:oligopeptide transport system substrate-binding protein